LYAARELWRMGQLKVNGFKITDASFNGVCFNLARKSYPSTPNTNRITKADAEATLPPADYESEKVRAKVLTAHYQAMREREDATGVNLGRVSTAQIDTLAEVYEQALTTQAFARNLKVDDKQRELLERLRGKGNTYFKRVDGTRTPRDLDQWCADFVAEAKQIRDTERNPSLRTRNPDHCTRPGSGGCSYHCLCVSRENAKSRAGKNILGFVRVDDIHQEVRHASLGSQPARKRDFGAGGGQGRDPGVGREGQGQAPQAWPAQGLDQQTQVGGGRGRGGDREAQEGEGGEGTQGGESHQSQAPFPYGF
jgi:hypothetical protein